jgi:hypothetical protein
MLFIDDLTISEQIKEYQMLTDQEIVDVNEFEAWKFDIIFETIVDA